ncbi:Site-specific DNA recombinase [Paenibacillus sp. yr247]|uniref:recombinase family protein n=1 Tax=Paenibacillus sp. yr247 TaxID=1761880 RepID=UPI00089230F2|nr:recombinase family protein [Paenibacillus sp. yr247]SDO18547.1 Site-specific DNA recombinase [Paenibacillus sp. yr247]
MSSELFGYARVSSVEQNLDRQTDELHKNGVRDENLFMDKMTGATLERPGFDALQQRLREGDVVITESLSRLSRTTTDLLNIINDWQQRGITYISLKESIDFSTSTGKLILSVMASISEFERNMIRDRVKEGIASARSRGRVGGRKPTDKSKVVKAIKLYESKTHSLKEIRDVTGVTESVLYRALRKQASSKSIY